MTSDQFLKETDLFGRLVRATNFLLDNWWVGALALVLLWLALWLRARHALIAKLDERAGAAFGDVDALLVERHTLVGNLTQVVRSFANREHEVIRDVLDARVEALEAVNGAIRTETQIADALQNLFAVSESYPTLASERHYARLRDDLVRIEDRITAARRFYNLSVEEMNAVRRAFPGRLLGWNMPTREKFGLGERRAEFAEPVRIAL